MAHILFRDALFNIVFAFFVMLWMILPHINDPSKKLKEADPPGTLAVAITWPQGDTDVDLWTTGPGEMGAVGYSNLSGLLWNLLRDDLGNMPDALGLNFEHAYTRGIVPGEYVINVHCFRCPTVPVPVMVEITLHTGQKDKTARPVLVTKTVLTRNMEEKTVVRFKLDERGNVSGINSVPRKLRSNSQ